MPPRSPAGAYCRLAMFNKALKDADEALALDPGPRGSLFPLPSLPPLLPLSGGNKVYLNPLYSPQIPQGTTFKAPLIYRFFFQTVFLFVFDCCSYQASFLGVFLLGDFFDPYFGGPGVPPGLKKELTPLPFLHYTSWSLPPLQFPPPAPRPLSRSVVVRTHRPCCLQLRWFGTLNCF